MVFLSVLLLSALLNSSNSTETVSNSSQPGTNDDIADDVQLIWPFSALSNTSDYPFSSPYGPRLQASKSYAYDFHRGIDIPRTNGTDLHAVQGGKIFRARTSSSGDLYIALRINHTSTGKSLIGYNYFYAIYRHLNQTLVSENDTVSQGDVITSTLILLKVVLGKLTILIHSTISLTKIQEPQLFQR